MAVIIDNDLCIGCLDCTIVCSLEALTWIDGKIICDKEICVECGTCIEVCEVGAIIL